MNEQFCSRCKEITAKLATREEYYSRERHKLRVLKRCRKCLELTIHMSRYSIISNSTDKKLINFEKEMEEMANSDEGHWWVVAGICLDI